MVLTEGSRETEVNRPKTLIAVGVGLVLLLATVALGLATAPDEVTAQESTTTTTEAEPLHQPTTTTTTATVDPETFSIGDIATGERLSWREAPSINASWPIDLVEHRGRWYLFTSSVQPHPRRLSDGLQVWVSEDGVAWDRAGEVTEAAITSIAVTDDRLVAMGTHTEDGSPHVWTSTDGMEWTPSRLPMSVEAGPSISTWLADAGLAGDQMIITGSGYTDPQAVIRDLLPPEVAEHVDRSGIGLSPGPDGRSVVVYGPLGIVAYRAMIEDLGIDEQTLRTLFGGSGPGSAYVWTSVDGTEWTITETDGPFLEDLWNVGSEELLASGWDNMGPAVWSSPDGITWSRTDSRLVHVVDSWNEWLLGTRNDRDLVRSRDGRDWESLGTDAVLPRPLDWYLQAAAIGDGGIAAVATTWTPQPDSQAEPITVEVGDHTLSIDQNIGRLTVEGPSGRSVVSLWTEDSAENVVVDFGSEQMTFLDVDTGDELLTIGFERLQEVERSLFSRPGSGERALLLSRGDGEWSVLDLAEEIGYEEYVVMMRVLEDRMVLVTSPIQAWYADSQPAWSIKVATLP